VAIFKLHGAVESVAKVRQGLEKLRGALFQRPPLISAVKRQLRVRTVYDSKLLDYDESRNMGKSGFIYPLSSRAGASLLDYFFLQGCSPPKPVKHQYLPSHANAHCTC